MRRGKEPKVQTRPRAVHGHGRIPRWTPGVLLLLIAAWPPVPRGGRSGRRDALRPRGGLAGARRPRRPRRRPPRPRPRRPPRPPPDRRCACASARAATRSATCSASCAGAASRIDGRRRLRPRHQAGGQAHAEALPHEGDRHRRRQAAQAPRPAGAHRGGRPGDARATPCRAPRPTSRSSRSPASTPTSTTTARRAARDATRASTSWPTATPRWSRSTTASSRRCRAPRPASAASTSGCSGADGVQYYYAHMESIAEGLDVGSRITVGQVVGVRRQHRRRPERLRPTCTSRSGTSGRRSTRIRTSRRSTRPPAPHRAA